MPRKPAADPSASRSRTYHAMHNAAAMPWMAFSTRFIAKTRCSGAAPGPTIAVTVTVTSIHKGWKP